MRKIRSFLIYLSLISTYYHEHCLQVVAFNFLTNTNRVRKPYPYIGSPFLQSPSTPTPTRLGLGKWNPRWNPQPDSDFYGKGDYDVDGYNKIHFSGRGKKSKFIPVYGKNRLFSLQRFLVVSFLYYFNTNSYSVNSAKLFLNLQSFLLANFPFRKKLLNVAFFMKQIQSAIQYLPILNNILQQSGYPSDLLFTKLDLFIEQFLLGSTPTVVKGKLHAIGGQQYRAYGSSLVVASTLGPFTMDFINQRLLTRIQPHRYFTSGFLHGNALHLLLNMSYLWKMPRWVENNGGSGNGLSGWCLYLITYISSIVGGNLFRDYFSTTASGMTSLCLGASGGICGLNGLMFIMARKMDNSIASMNVLKNMFFILATGSVASGISNASHIGGFMCGAIIGHFFAPNYRRGYSSGSSSRWNFNENDASIEYKMMMGQGIQPDKAHMPLKFFLGGLSLLIALKPELWSIPMYLLKGFEKPGVLSGMAMQ